MTRIQVRRDTSERFTSFNPILAEGEPAYETDTKKIKMGDGSTYYNDLPYLDSGSGGGGGGESTTDYSDLTNKPQINGKTLEGNLTTEQLGIDIPDTSDLVNNTELNDKLADYAKTSELPDTSNFAKLDAQNTFTVSNEFSRGATSTGNYARFTVDNGVAYSGNMRRIDISPTGMSIIQFANETIRRKGIWTAGGFATANCLNPTGDLATIDLSTDTGYNISIKNAQTAEKLLDVAYDKSVFYDGILTIDKQSTTSTFSGNVKIGIKGNPSILYLQSEQQISRATEDGGLFYTVESEIQGTKIKSMTQEAYNALDTPDENTIYLIEEE